MSTVRIWVIKFCHHLGWVKKYFFILLFELSQFEILSFVTILFFDFCCYLSLFEFSYYLSFRFLSQFEICHNLSFWVFSQFWFCHKGNMSWISSGSIVDENSVPAILLIFFDCQSISFWMKLNNDWSDSQKIGLFHFWKWSP